MLTDITNVTINKVVTLSGPSLVTMTHGRVYPRVIEQGNNYELLVGQQLIRPVPMCCLYRVSQKEVPPTFEKSLKKIRICYG